MHHLCCGSICNYLEVVLMQGVFPAATLIDVHNDESFLPLQPQFKDKLLACVNMLSTTDY